MRKFIISIIILITYISYIDAQDEFEEFNQLQRKAKRPSFGHWLGPLGYGFGFHALAILYWLKVKAIIIAFIVGTAIVWGSRYIFANNKSCPKEVIHEGPIIPFSHGPLWSSHDHIPYSPSFSPSYYDHHHHHDHGIESFPSSSFLDTSPSSISTSEHFAADKKWKRESRQLESEEQISTIFFTFLGVDSDACRRRFVCEWEFKAKRTPITNLVFRIFGRGIFTKYLKDENEVRSFKDCEKVYNECRFIEHHIPEKEYEDSNEENDNIVNTHNNDDNDNNVLNSEDENENENKNEIESNTQLSDDSYEKPEDKNENQNKDILNNTIDYTKIKHQPEVKLHSFSNKEGVKNKNFIAEKLFNRSRSKLRVVPVRSK